MKKIITVILVILLATNFIQSITIVKLNKTISDYEYYYNASENLLDELDNAYNWTDAYEDYKYYEIKDKIKSDK